MGFLFLVLFKQLKNKKIINLFEISFISNLKHFHTLKDYINKIFIKAIEYDSLINSEFIYYPDNTFSKHHNF